MAFLSHELLQTGDPVDAERARLIGAMLASRGEDIPLPESNEAEPTEAEPAEAEPPAVLPEAFHPANTDNALQRIRDGFAGRSSATDDLDMYSGTGATLGESLLDQQNKQRVDAETAAFSFALDTMNALIPRNTVERAPYNGGPGVYAKDVDHFKRLRSVLLFGNSRVLPDVIIGATDYEGKEIQHIITQTVGSMTLQVAGMKTSDLEILRQISQFPASEEVSEEFIATHILNDGRYLLSDVTPGTINHAKRKMFEQKAPGERKVEYLHPRKTGASFRPDLEASIRNRRLPEDIIEEFKIAEHLADLVTILDPKLTLSDT